MKRTFLTLAVLSLLAPALRAQQGGDVPERFERKAERMIKDDPSYGNLAPVEERIVIATIAKKLRDANRYNWAHVSSGRQKVSAADVNVVVNDSDLDGLYAKYPKLAPGQPADKKRVVPDSETQAPPGEPIEIEIPDETDLHEVHGDPFQSLFKDNEWTLQEDSDDALDLIDQIDDAIKTAGKKGFITGVTIKSSASTLPNSGRAANMTFLQLSQARTDDTLKFILKKLLEKGVVLDQSQVQRLPKGANEDGTSGPPPPNSDYWKKEGKTPPDKDDYDQYKYVDVTFQVKLPEEESSHTELIVPEGDWSSRVVTLDMAVKTKHWRIWKNIKKLFVFHKHAKRTRSQASGKKKMIPCPEVQKQKAQRARHSKRRR